ncbi:MAG: BON domain-containing protein [Candidatus Korobacteraceae bacterium]|jgi:osmotically-inducible protein OsmY
MRNRLLLLTLTIFLATANAALRQNPDSSATSGEAATPGREATAGDNRPSEPGLPGISSATESENQRLREQILNALRADSSLASSSLNVEVSGSQIVLSGSVPTARERETARRIAQSYGNNRGVRAAEIDVRNAGRAEEKPAPGR